MPCRTEKGKQICTRTNWWREAMGIDWYSGSGGSQPPDTTSDGKQVFLVIGDSKANGAASTVGDLPAEGDAFRYVSGELLPFIDEVGTNAKSPWPKFCINYKLEYDKKPVMVIRGAGTSTISPADDDNDWQLSGDNYAPAVSAANDCLTLLGLTKLKGILIILGINDFQGSNGTGAFSVAQVQGYWHALIENLRTEFGADVPIVFSIPGRTTAAISTRLTGIRNVLRLSQDVYDNVYIGSCETGFTIAGYWEADNIHFNKDGNEAIGSMMVRSFSNSAYSNKWSRAIISCHFDELSEARKNLIDSFITTHLTDYKSLDCLYNFKNTLKINTGFDWTFLCGPGADGGFSFTANSHVGTNGTSQMFRTAFNASVSSLNVTQEDMFIEVKIRTKTTANNVNACAVGVFDGSQLTRIAQNTSSALLYSINAASSQAHGAVGIPVASVIAARDGATEYLYLDGVLTDSREESTSIAVLNIEQSVGGLNSGAPRLNATYHRCIIGKFTGIADISLLVTSLNSLQDNW